MALNSSTMKRPGRQPFALLCLTVVLAFPAVAYAQGARPAGSAPTQASSTPAAPSAEVEELLLLPTVNEVSESEPRLMLRDRAGQLWLAENDLKGWRIRIPAGEPRVFDGIRYWRLSSIEGASSRLDERALKAELRFPATAFEASQVSGGRAAGPVASRPGWGGFLSYDLLAQHVTGRMGESGAFELGMFSPLGVGVTGVLMRERLTTGIDQSRYVRLESTWTLDNPERMTSLRIGDGISRSAAGWGRSVRFAGLQYGTNFATRPGLVLVPQQSFSGSAVVPSTVDVYINNALVSQQKVPAGPFSIGNIPTAPGPGMMQVVVRDLLGREQVIQQPFFGSSFLLREGLDDYSFEAGALRRNFGLISEDYGSSFASMTWRRGWTSNFTGEGHFEVGQGGQLAAGLGAAVLLGELGTVNLSAAGSNSDRGRGGLAGLSLLRQGKLFSLGLRTQFASAGFWQLGLDPGDFVPSRTVEGVMGFNLSKGGALSLGLFQQDFRQADRDPIRLATASWSSVIMPSVFGGLTFSQSFSGERNRTLGLFVNWMIDARTSASGNATRTSTRITPGDWAGAVSMQRAVPVGEGWGWRLRADDNRNLQAGTTLQTGVGAYNLELARQGSDTAARLGVQGGLIFMEGKAFASRRTTDSFALVRVPGHPGVRVFSNNQPVATTDADGVAIVPRLLAYQRNVISIDEQDFPLDTQLGTLRADAVPWYRSGTVVQFEAKRVASAEFTVVNERGEPLPKGLTIRLEGQPESSVTIEGGRAYLSGLQAKNRAIVTLPQGRCVVEFDFKAGSDPLPDLGRLTCRRL
ncbi:MAG: fimbria/pilus outer membrane usher protein [Burkholderiaceae bacterium]